MPELSRRISQVVTGGRDGWQVHYRAQRIAVSGPPVVMLSVGDHDIKTDPQTLAAMTGSAEAGNLGYTSVAGSAKLRRAIAERVTRQRAVPAGPENVLVTSGGQGAIFTAMNAVLDPGEACIVLDPFYASFDQTVRAVAGAPVIVPTRPEEGFQPDPAAIAAAVTPNTRAILINTPNNPTGAVYRRERLAGLAEVAAAYDLWIIADELYDSQVHEGAHVSIRDLPGMARRTLVIGSMSKGFAMTGCRLGWVVGPEPAIERMTHLAGTTTYGLPGFIQDGAHFALTEQPAQEAEVAARYRRRRDLALAALGNARHLGVVPPKGGMYVMLDVRPTGLSGNAFAERLLDAERIAVMPGESFGSAAAGHVRIALTVPDDVLSDAVARIARFAERVAAEEVA